MSQLRIIIVAGIVVFAVIFLTIMYLNSTDGSAEPGGNDRSVQLG